MEAFRELEKTHITISWIQSHGLSSSSDNPNHDRFLADFLLFLGKNNGMVNLEEKCELISEFMPKIVPAVLEELMPCVAEEGDRDFCVQPINEICNDNGIPVIGFDAMEQANSTLEDFCRSYFMFHGMDVNKPQSVFKYLPVLSFTESYIYQLDRLNEEISNLSAKGAASDTFKMKRNPKYTDNFLEAFKVDPFKTLLHLLKCHGLLTARIREEFRSGEEYWHLERRLCHAISNKNEIMVEDVMRAIQLKSFDYRVLNLLLYQLNGKQVNDLVMEFLSISEFLVEVSDDLFDYEEDVLAANFNILRMFVEIYGPAMAPVMLAKCITEAEQKYEHISKTLDPDLSLNYWKRCEEATREGGNTSAKSLGTWNIPPVIADEDLYRSKYVMV